MIPRVYLGLVYWQSGRKRPVVLSGPDVLGNSERSSLRVADLGHGEHRDRDDQGAYNVIAVRNGAFGAEDQA
jgi:hypothetical protein